MPFLIRSHTFLSLLLSFHSTRHARRHIISTASEDSTVQLHDLRTHERIAKLKPAAHVPASATAAAAAASKGPAAATWVGSVRLREDGDWLACGGGVPLTAWQMRNMARPARICTPNHDDSVGSGSARRYCIQDLAFSPEGIVTVGNAPVISHWPFSGQVRQVEDATGIDSIFSVRMHERSNDAMTICGAGPEVGVFFGPRYGYCAGTLGTME